MWYVICDMYDMICMYLYRARTEAGRLEDWTTGQPRIERASVRA